MTAPHRQPLCSHMCPHRRDTDMTVARGAWAWRAGPCHTVHVRQCRGACRAAPRRSSALTLPGSRARTALQSASASAQRPRRSRASARLLAAAVRPASSASAAL